MSRELPPCDHDECPPSHCRRSGSLAAPVGYAVVGTSKTGLGKVISFRSPVTGVYSLGIAQEMCAKLTGLHSDWTWEIESA